MRYNGCMIVGIDEVGRGPWAGPLVVGAVVLGCEIDGLTDSKKLSKKRREALDTEIRENAVAFGLGWVNADEIDEFGLSAALVAACKRALEQITVPYHEIIIDGTINFLKDTGKGPYVTTMKKADLLVPSVSAASIIAKVARDAYMNEQHEKYPEYGFSSHVGYGTAVHRAAIEKHGVTPLHRLSFAPLAQYRPTARSRNGFAQGSTRAPASGRTLAVDISKNQQSSTTKQIGDQSEGVAADYFRREGHEILERNWKTKYCEIDIVSQKDDTYYFTEVKHRRNAHGGGGIAAITKKKLAKMRFAAKFYAQNKKLVAGMRMLVVTTTGDEPMFESSLEVE